MKCLICREEIKLERNYFDELEQTEIPNMHDDCLKLKREAFENLYNLELDFQEPEDDN